MRYTNNILEFNKNNKRIHAKFEFNADSFIYDSYSAFKIINGVKEDMTDDEKHQINSFVANYEVEILLSELKLQKINRAKEIRKKKINNFKYKDVIIGASSDTQNAILSVINFLKLNPEKTVNFKARDYIELTLTEAEELYALMLQYIQTCFNYEYLTISEINACEDKDSLNKLIMNERAL